MAYYNVDADRCDLCGEVDPSDVYERIMWEGDNLAACEDCCVRNNVFGG